MNQQLDIKRLGFMARRDFINRWRSLSVAAGAVSGVLILIVLIELLFTRRSSVEYVAYLRASLIIWGCIDASMAFLSLQNKTMNEGFLLLPASALEKTLVRLLFTSLVLPFFILAVVFLSSVVGEALGALFFRDPFVPIRMFGVGHLKTIGYVVIAQSVFFLGAAWFKKAHLVKTVFALIVISIAFGFVAAFLFRIVFASYFTGFFIPKDVNVDMESLMAMR